MLMLSRYLQVIDIQPFFWLMSMVDKSDEGLSSLSREEKIKFLKAIWDETNRD
jgi:hypothetical protein